jgi:hypothetical protein
MRMHPRRADRSALLILVGTLMGCAQAAQPARTISRDQEELPAPREAYLAVLDSVAHHADARSSRVFVADSTLPHTITRTDIAARHLHAKGRTYRCGVDKLVLIRSVIKTAPASYRFTVIEWLTPKSLAGERAYDVQCAEGSCAVVSVAWGLGDYLMGCPASP